MSRSLTATATMTETLAHALGRQIVIGVFAAHAFPTESQICDLYQASRTVVREATKMLVAKGLVDCRARRGVTVRPEGDWNLLDPDILGWIHERRFSLDLLIEFTELRLCVEPMAAALAARRAEPCEAVLKAALARRQAAARGEDDDVAAEAAFHTAILDASGNRFHRQMRDVVEAAIRFGARRPAALRGQDDGCRSALTIFDAITTGRANDAAHAMKTFLAAELSTLAAERLRRRLGGYN